MSRRGAALVLVAMTLATAWTRAAGTETAPGSGAPTGTVRPGISRVAVVGDSLTSGFATPGYPWTASAQAMLDAAQIPATLVNSSAAGAGYAARGDQNHNFADLVRLSVTSDTAVVLIFGSDNDTADPGYAAAVGATVELAQRLAPQARVLLIGPPATPADPAGALSDIRNVLRGAAVDGRAGFVDALDWFAGPAVGNVGPDGEHPTVAGQDYLARRITPLLVDAVGGSGRTGAQALSSRSHPGPAFWPPPVDDRAAPRRQRLARRAPARRSRRCDRRAEGRSEGARASAPAVCADEVSRGGRGRRPGGPSVSRRLDGFVSPRP